MNLSKLTKIVTRPAKRVGRGYGSGKGGHTSGRGQKGQKARSKIPLTFEGTKIKKSLLKRLPLLRGKGRMKPQRARVVNIRLADLADWPTKTEVTVENLIKREKVNAGTRAVKVLDGGEAKTGLSLGVGASASVVEKITKAGGKISRK